MEPGTRSRLSLLALALVVVASSARAQDTRPAAKPPEDRVVAKVNRRVITQSDLEKALPASSARLTGKELERALDTAKIRLVLESVETDAVAEIGLRVPRRFVEERLEKEKEEAYKQGDTFQDLLEERGATEDEFRDDLQSRIQRQTYLAAASGTFKAQQFRPDYWPEPTVADLRSYYRRRLTEEFTLKNRARVFAIALPFSQFPADKGRPVDERARDVAKLIREKLATGADFATLARQYSRTEAFKPQQGGDLGWLEEEKSPYDPSIVKYAFSAPLRSLSEPIPYPRPETARQLLLLWVEERVERRVVSFEEAQEEIREGLRRERLRVAQAKIQAELLEKAYIWPPQLKQSLLGIVR
jgi:parvulin-like peptidyl-prolyl isomerase